MAKHHWLANRAIRLQDRSLEFSLMRDNAISPNFALLIRYQTTNERAFQKAFSTLQALRKESRTAEIGFASQKVQQPANKGANDNLIASVPPKSRPQDALPATNSPATAKSNATRLAMG
jgi:hypothetical protein